MFDYNSDNEQSELLHNLWNNNKGKIISAILALLLGIYFGQNYYNNKLKESGQAADLFYELANTKDQKIAKTIQVKFPNSTYSQLTELWQAKQLVSNKSWPLALEKYEKIIAHTKIDSIKQLATWYKIHVLIEMHNYAKALSELENYTTDQDIKNELLGDIYVLTNKRSLAYNAYSAAMDASQDTRIKQRIMLKRQNIYQTP